MEILIFFTKFESYLCLLIKQIRYFNLDIILAQTLSTQYLKLRFFLAIIPFKNLSSSFVPNFSWTLISAGCMLLANFQLFEDSKNHIT